MTGPCAKQIVVCEIVNLDTGTRWIGENSCDEAQPVCPRGDLPSGVGYEKCKEVCKQGGHAEEKALALVDEPLTSGVAYIYGHSYVCANCHTRLREGGVQRIILMRDSVVLT